MNPILQINKKMLPMKMHFFIGIAGTAPIVAFLSSLSRQRGYSSVIVGLIFTILPIPGLLLRPVIGALTDKYKCRRTAMIWNSIIMAILACALLLMPGAAIDNQIDDNIVIKSPIFWLFFGTITLFFSATIVRAVLEDTICFSLLGEDKHKYGQQRVWGAIGWGAISLLSGLCVDYYSKGLINKDYTPAFAIAVICLLLDAFVILKIENAQKIENEIIVSDVGKLLTKIKVLTFLLWIVAFGFFSSFIWNYLFLYMEDLANFYHSETKPWIKTIQGFALVIQCFGGEVPFFYLSSIVLKRVDHMKVLSLMFFTFALRFALYSIIRNPVWVLPVELLNGITFALAYSAAVSYADNLAPTGAEGTLQGIVGVAFMGIGLPIGNFAGGYLFDRFGSIVSFEILSCVALVVGTVQIIVDQILKGLSKRKKLSE